MIAVGLKLGTVEDPLRRRTEAFFASLFFRIKGTEDQTQIRACEETKGRITRKW